MTDEHIRIDRRAALTWGVRGAVAAALVAAGCSSSSGSAGSKTEPAPTTEPASTTKPAAATTTTAPQPAVPSLQPPATADQLQASALVYTSPDGSSNHLGSFEPTPDGRRPTIVGIGDSVLLSAYGIGTKSVDPATGAPPGPRTGIARWHDGKDPTYHDARRPSTSETSRFGFDDKDKIVAWLPGARELIAKLPVDGCLIQASHTLYGAMAPGGTQAEADLHLAELRHFVEMADAKAAERGRFALTVLFPPLVRNSPLPRNFDASLDASRQVLAQLRALRPDGIANGVRFELETGWWQIVEPLLEAHDQKSLVALHDPADGAFPVLDHPNPDQDGGIRYGELVVAAYERMGAYARTGR